MPFSYFLEPNRVGAFGSLSKMGSDLDSALRFLFERTGKAPLTTVTVCFHPVRRYRRECVSREQTGTLHDYPV